MFNPRWRRRGHDSPAYLLAWFFMALLVIFIIAKNVLSSVSHPMQIPVQTPIVLPKASVSSATSPPVIAPPTNSPSTNSTDVSIDFSSVIEHSVMSTGATHTQNSIDNGQNPQAVNAAKSLIRNALDYQNVQIMGWGADDPEPTQGVYNWSTLDERVQLMRATGATMVLTLCCAPSWMRPAGYQNEWQDLEIAPDATHVQDFANLCAKIALRYPDVKYFQVWNELKGMWSNSPGASPGLASANRWDYVRYTSLYNAVYDTVKKARPDALLGGPYVVMNSHGDASQMSSPGPHYTWGTLDQRVLDVISYWLQYKHGADFITVDGSTGNDDHVWPVDPFSSAQKFADVAKWIRQQGNGGSTLPIWWAEWYVTIPTGASNNLAYDNALMANAEVETLQSGVTVPLLWGPQGDEQGFSFPEGIWTDTSSANGGRATPYYTTEYDFKTYFGPGTALLRVQTSNDSITALASAQMVMLINHLSEKRSITVNGLSCTLEPYAVMLLPASFLFPAQ